MLAGRDSPAQRRRHAIPAPPLPASAARTRRQRFIARIQLPSHRALLVSARAPAAPAWPVRWDSGVAATSPGHFAVAPAARKMFDLLAHCAAFGAWKLEKARRSSGRWATKVICWQIAEPGVEGEPEAVLVHQHKRRPQSTPSTQAAACGAGTTGESASPARRCNSASSSSLLRGAGGSSGPHEAMDCSRG